MLNTENTGLIIVDVQGKLARMVYESESLITNITKLIKGCQILGLPIIWLEQYPKGLGKTVPEIAELLSHQTPMEKTYFNAIAENTIKNAIKAANKQNWLVCGIEAHICVYQTLMGLSKENYHVEVVVDAISSRKKESIDIALNKLAMNKISITNVEMCLYELMKNAQSEKFKDILRLIK